MGLSVEKRFVARVVPITATPRFWATSSLVQYPPLSTGLLDASKYEVFEGLRDNFIFGFLGAMLVVFIATRTDIAVFIGYLVYYFFMGKIVNRPKYITDFGQLIVFPIPSALGAFTGYKLSYLILHLI
jgi:hypothetical protein